MPNAKTLPTLEVFLDSLAASRILPRETWEEIRESANNLEPATSKALARRLVQQGVLTAWQARRLLAGITQFHIANYVLEDQLSVSPLGRVFRARHQSLDRTVAIRVFHRELTQDSATAAELLRECRQAASLDHRNLIHIYDVGQEHGRVYLVMEHCSATHLARRVAEKGPLDTAATVDILLQVADALGHLHDQGVVHGDIRPENILCDDEHRIKVVGLGGRTLRDRIDDSGETNIGIGEETADDPDVVVTGSLGAFASPEQLQGDQPTTRSDVYSLGCLAYFLLVGEAPSHDPAERTPLAQRRPETARSLVRVVTRMMARRPAERYRDAAIVREILADLKDEVGHIAAVSSPARRMRGQRGGGVGDEAVERDSEASSSRKWVVVVAALALLLAGAAAAGSWLWWQSRSTDRDLVDSGQASGTAGGFPLGEPHGDTSAADGVEARAGAGEHSLPGIGSDGAADGESPAVGTGEPAGPDMAATGQTRAAGAVAPPGLDDGEGAEPESAAETEPPSMGNGDSDKAAGEGAAAAPAPVKPEADNEKKAEKKSGSPKKAPPKQAKKKAAPKKKPAPRPFARLPRTVSLPPPDAGTQPVVLGEVVLGPRDIVFARLLGGSQAVRGKEEIKLASADGGLAARKWTVSLERTGSKTPIATFEIVEGKLQFHWEPQAAGNKSAAHLANTVLSLSSSGQIHKLALREPVVAPPLPIDLNRASTSQKYRIAASPDPAVLFAEVVRLSDGLPKAAYDPDKSIPLARKSLKIRLGEKPEESLFFLELSFKASRSQITVSVKPYFQVDPDTPSKVRTITAREVASLLKQQEIQQQQLVAQIQQIKQFQKNLAKARVSEQKRRQQSALAAQQLNLAEQDLQRISVQRNELEKINALQTAVGKSGRIYIRLYIKVGEDRIVVLETTDDAGEEGDGG